MRRKKTDKELLQEVEGIGPKRSESLLSKFGSGGEVASAATSAFGRFADTEGVSEDTARDMFDRMGDAGVREELRDRFRTSDQVRGPSRPTDIGRESDGEFARPDTRPDVDPAPIARESNTGEFGLDPFDIGTASAGTGGNGGVGSAQAPDVEESGALSPENRGLFDLAQTRRFDMDTNGEQRVSVTPTDGGVRVERPLFEEREVRGGETTRQERVGSDVFTMDRVDFERRVERGQMQLASQDMQGVQATRGAQERFDGLPDPERQEPTDREADRAIVTAEEVKRR